MRSTLQKMRQWAKEAEPFSRAVAEAQYDRTQACLAEAGLDSVVIYRSMARKFADDFVDARTGWDFLYGVMTARVPASAAVSTFPRRGSVA